MLRRLFIFSDLHLGGRPDRRDEAGRLVRGFQFCHAYAQLIEFIDWIAAHGGEGVDEFEVVINGDIVDFLADDDFPHGQRAQAFTPEPGDVLAKLAHIEERTRVGAPASAQRPTRSVFDALRALATRPGGRLTLLLGNHDVELALPQVRRWLYERLGGEAARLHFSYDGEAYTLGDLLIEHGNRYDRWNQVDHSRLRQERSMRSRGLRVAASERAEYFFIPPPGTFLVTRFMNRIKQRYGFIDLLKPEDAAVIPLLVALEPDYSLRIDDILKAAPITAGVGRHGSAAGGLTRRPGDLTSLIDFTAGEESLRGVLAELGAEGQPLLRLLRRHAATEPAIDPAGNLANWREQPSAPASGGRFARLMQWLEDKCDQLDEAGDSITALDAIRNAADYEERLVMLHTALATLGRNDASFVLNRESAAYLDGAAEIARQGGYKYIFFGHTHLPKHIVAALPDSFAYFNTGTWTDVMRLPFATSEPFPQVRGLLDTMLADIKANRLGAYTRRYLTYAEVLYDGTRGAVVRADLRSYCGADQPRQPPLCEHPSAAQERARLAAAEPRHG